MSVIDKAKQIIDGDREQTYGKADVNLNRIAYLWNAYVRGRFDSSPLFTAQDVCWMMVLLKTARQMNADKEDNLVDAIGYIALIEKIGGDHGDRA
jgi:hypothetical protein